MIIELMLVLAIHGTSGAGRIFFRRDYTYANETNAFYKFHKTRLKFSEATSACSGEGARLMAPKSTSEAEVASKVAEAQRWWIGVHDLYGEGTFAALDGTPMDELYINWAPGEPDNDDTSDEDCVVMDEYGTMSDVQCQAKHHFVCVRSASNLTQNEECETYDQEYRFHSFKCYKLHTHPMVWNEAYKTCRREEANLAVINGDAEARHLVVELAKQHPATLPGNFDKSLVHVGFNDLLEQGTYQTVDGMTLGEAGYERWASGRPENKQCGSMLRDGTLKDIDCKTRAMFVCEKKLSDYNTLRPR